MENKKVVAVVGSGREKIPTLTEIIKMDMRKQYRNERVITTRNMICTFVNAKFFVKHAITKKIVSFDTLEEAVEFMAVDE